MSYNYNWNKHNYNYYSRNNRHNHYGYHNYNNRHNRSKYGNRYSNYNNFYTYHNNYNTNNSTDDDYYSNSQEYYDAGNGNYNHKQKRSRKHFNEKTQQYYDDFGTLEDNYDDEYDEDIEPPHRKRQKLSFQTKRWKDTSKVSKSITEKIMGSEINSINEVFCDSMQQILLHSEKKENK